MSTSQPIVVVTGATGYVATAIVDLLVRRGRYQVRGTVRSLQNSRAKQFQKEYPNVQLFEADLTRHGQTHTPTHCVHANQ